MPINDFKAFAISENANVLKQSEYESLPAVGEGFQSGIARSEELNKVWRQASTIASVIASFMANNSGQDVLDNGDLNTLQETLLKALLNNSTSQLDDRYLNAELNLSDLNNVEVARNSLELKSAATHDVQTSNEDRTPNRALLTGNALPTIKTPLSVDLNTLGSYNQDGVYYQSSDVNAIADKHYPIQLSGTLLVTPSAYGCQQEYTTYSTSRKFMRSLLGVWNGNGPWSTWVEVYSESHKPSAHDVESISTAAQMLSNGINQDGVSNNDLNNVKPNSTAFVYSDTLNNTSGRNLVLLDYMNQQFDRYRVQLGFCYDPGGGVFGRTKNGDNSSWNGMFEFYTTSKKPTPSEVGAVPSIGGSVGYLDSAEYYDTKPDIEPRGSGSFAAQLNSGAPFYVQNFSWAPNSGGHYVPLVKGRSVRIGQGWPSAVSFGYLLPGGDRGFAQPSIHVIGDGIDRAWVFDPATGAINIGGVGNVASEAYAQGRANEAHEQAKTWAYQNLVSKVQVSDVQEYIDIPYPGQAYPPAGASMSAIDGATKSTGSGISFHISRIYFRRLQHVINGIPYNIA